MHLSAQERALISSFDYRKKLNWVSSFHAFDIRLYEKMLREKGEVFWQRHGERQALRLFHDAAERVPAYKDFLRKYAVSPAHITTIRDFSHVPPTDKENYICEYSLEDRCWDGYAGSSSFVAMSSGMSGESTFWPRGGYQEFEASVAHELLYSSFFDIKDYSTLLVICFPMGIYVSGVATMLPSWLVSEKGYDMMVVSAGNNKQEALKVLHDLHRSFDQIVLAGHPLFIKDLLETGSSEFGIRWSTVRTHLLFCSEGFSEKWRRYVCSLLGKENHARVMSVYGSSDVLLMAYETPFSVFLRQLIDRRKRLRTFFGGVVPSLFQYNPLIRYVESVDNELLFTSPSGVPLIRYNIHDAGSVVSFDALRRLVFQEYTDAAHSAEAGKGGTMWQLPFLTLFGRSDNTVIFYAVNIYPEHIRLCLDYVPFLKTITGKFVLRKVYTRRMEECLEVHIELRKGQEPDDALEKSIQERIVSHLKKINMEYLDASRHLDKDMRPRIVLWPYRHEKYFMPGKKPRYIV